MSNTHSNILIILDDRELTSGDVCNIVGIRRFGDIIFKRRRLFDHFRSALPAWARTNLTHIQSDADLNPLRLTLEACSENTAVCIIAGRSGFTKQELLSQFIERLPYAEEDFADTLYKPLIVFFRHAHKLVAQWPEFMIGPIHTWSQSWQEFQRLKSLQPLDLNQIQDFLSFTSGSTATRHFNEVQIDAYYYTKRSSDKRKMQAEYSFCSLVPERMRPWLIQPFDFQDEGERASYKMLRYYLADAALQWVHGAFEPTTFTAFIERLLFFVSDRPQQVCEENDSTAKAKDLFVDKVKKRVHEFLAMPEGQSINQLATSATPELDLSNQLTRYLKLYNRFARGFSFNYHAIGHGDPCLSNVLYDQQRCLLKLIDPKGALSEQDLWTNPLYDLCKISHSILGDYDFINNGLYNVGFTDHNDLTLRFEHTNHEELKSIFLSKVKDMGHDVRIMRLGEASLFLSMLPLHIDYPNKVIAFMLKAHKILDEVEN